MDKVCTTREINHVREASVLDAGFLSPSLATFHNLSNCLKNICCSIDRISVCFFLSSPIHKFNLRVLMSSMTCRNLKTRRTTESTREKCRLNAVQSWWLWEWRTTWTNYGFQITQCYLWLTPTSIFQPSLNGMSSLCGLIFFYMRLNPWFVTLTID